MNILGKCNRKSKFEIQPAAHQVGHIYNKEKVFFKGENTAEKLKKVSKSKLLLLVKYF